jgi:hypothetical protein
MEAPESAQLSKDDVRTWKGIFDLPDAEGLNESERLLSRLCKRSFLSLWSYPNLHTDRDFANGKGSAKELCDLLVVFGNDVLIFSDKHVEFQRHNPLKVAWPRWYCAAVGSYAKQLFGALSWLQKFLERVFIDARCKRRPPPSLPLEGTCRFHLIAVTRGSHRHSCSGSHKLRFWEASVDIFIKIYLLIA